MVEFTRITKENIEWFKGMLPEETGSERALQRRTLMLGAVSDGAACGIIVVGYEKEMAELRWIYVSPEFRNQGIGKGLLDEIETEKKTVKIRQTMAIYPSDDNGEIMDRLLYSCGYTVNAVKTKNYYLSYRQLISLPVFKQMAEAKKNSRYHYQVLEEAPSYILKNQELSHGFITEACMKYSVVCFDDTHVVGYMMVNEKSETEHELSYLKIHGNKSSIVLSGLFGCYAENVVKKMKGRKLSPDTGLSFQVLDKKMEDFVTKVLGLEPDESVWFHIAKHEMEEA